MTIKFISDSLDDIVYENKFRGFLFVYKGIEYIVSAHHGLPIKKISKPIFIDTMWNELLIIKSNLINNKDKIKNIKISVPKINEQVFLILNKFERINMIITFYKFLNLNNLATNPRCLYIVAKYKGEFNNFKSLSGSPIFINDNKLIGIFCKQEDNEIYILPSYYIIKTLSKNNNNVIYGINYDKSIKKINNLKINSENKIYHTSLKLHITLDTYLMLEGDSNKKIIINGETSRYIDINSQLPISNERNIIRYKNKFLVNATLLILLQMINKRIMINFYKFIEDNIGNKLFLSINKDISNSNQMNYQIKFDEISYNFVIYTE